MNSTVGLFKYLAPSKLDFFERRLVLLTPPEYLNDPWDFLPKGRVPSNDEIVAAWQEVEPDIAKTAVIHGPHEFALRQQRERFERIQVGLRSPDDVAQQGAYYQREIGRIVGIVSLAEFPLSRTMWAHYAESHAGFVAEFAAGEEDEACGFRIRSCAVGPIVAAKVKYSAHFQQFIKDAENVHEICWSKHSDWEIEREWRIIWALHRFPSTLETVHDTKGRAPTERFCLPFAPNGLLRVIFGMRMQPEVKQRLRSMLDHEDFKNVRKERTDIDPETGELVLKPLDSAE